MGSGGKSHSIRKSYRLDWHGIRVIQVLLGHKKLETTSIYTHVATALLQEVIGPLELLPRS